MRTLDLITKGCLALVAIGYVVLCTSLIQLLMR